LSFPPRFSARLKFFGQATLQEKGISGKTLIGRRSLASKAELIDTIIHEELHHRIWKRAARGRKKDMMRIEDEQLEEAYVELISARFMRWKGL